MAELKKPELLKEYVWANGQETPGDSDLARPPVNVIAEGWVYGEKPPYSAVNWQHNLEGNMLLHINRYGIPEWDEKTGYAKGAITRYDDSGTGTNIKFYKALNDIPENLSGNPAPVNSTTANPTDWVEVMLPTVGDEGNTVIISRGPTDAGKLVMTDSDGKLNDSLMSIGVFSYKGDVDIEQPAPLEVQTPNGLKAVETGDVFIISNDPNGTFDSTFTGTLPGDTGYKGETIIAKVINNNTPLTHADVSWEILGTGINDNYLLRDGSKPMTGELILPANNPSGDTVATHKKYVDDNDNLMLKRDGSRDLDVGYAPQNTQSIATKTYVDTLRTYTDTSFIKTDGTNSMDAGYVPTLDQQPATKKYVDDINQTVNNDLNNTVSRDGSRPMLSSYVPTNPEDVVTVGWYQQESNKHVVSDGSGITGAREISNMVALLESDYNNLTTKDPNTLYLIL